MSRLSGVQFFGAAGRSTETRNMNQKIIQLGRLFAWAVACSATIGIASCNISSNVDMEPRAAASMPATMVAVAAQKSDVPGINLQCDVNHIRNAPAPFHWSFKKVATPDTNADWEANITHDSIAGTYIGDSGARTIHAVRSDTTAWNTASLALTGPLPASTFALVNNSSAISRAGAENVNGEDTINYTIDTSRDAPADASLIRNVLGANGFIRGSAWVTQGGCPVKFVLDVEQHNGDGTVEKERYEANVTQQ